MFAHPRLDFYSFVLKVFGILKTFFQKGFKRSARWNLATFGADRVRDLSVWAPTTFPHDFQLIKPDSMVNTRRTRAESAE